jgi:hypothetical protein
MTILADKDNGRNRKRAARAEQLAGTGIVAYASGRGNVRFTGTFVTVAVGLGVLMVATVAASHRIVVPGVVVVLVALASIRPHRGVAVTRDAVLVLHESMMNALPNRIVSAHHPSELLAVEERADRRGHAYVRLGTEVVRLRRGSYETLVEVVRGLTPAVPGYAPAVPAFAAGIPAFVPVPAGPGAPGWFPDPTGRFALRYWSEGAWTAHVARDGATAFDPLA